MPRKLVCIFYLVFAAFVGCDRSQPAPRKSADGRELQSVTLMLNWFPEAEHGGFYAAKVHGIFEKHGLDVEIRAGGPGANVAPELLSQRIQFAIGNADDILLFQQNQADIVALLAPIQNSPRCIVVHADSPIQNLNQLAGYTLMAGNGQPFRTFLEHMGLLKDVTIVPYDGMLANFIVDKKMITQGYSFSEPFVAKQQGADTRSLMVSDVGFNPYVSCLITTRDYVNNNRDVVGRMVLACREGWQRYLEDPKQTNQQILKLNAQGMTAEALEYGAQSIKPLCLPDGLPIEKLGTMTMERWKTLTDQFIEIGLAEAGRVKAEAVFDASFVSP